MFPAVLLEQQPATFDEYDGLAHGRDLGDAFPARLVEDGPAQVLACGECGKLLREFLSIERLRRIGRERLPFGVELRRLPPEPLEPEPLERQQTALGAEQREALEEERERRLARVGRRREEGDDTASLVAREVGEALEQRQKEMLDGVVAVGELAHPSVDGHAAAAP